MSDQDKKLLHHTVVTVDILSKEPYKLTDLADLHFDIGEGDCAGNYRVESRREVDGPTCRKLMEGLGEEPDDYSWPGLDDPATPEEQQTNEERFSAAIEDAIFGFFDIISKHYPEVKTGDFPPDADQAFAEASSTALEIWLRHNGRELLPS